MPTRCPRGEGGSERCRFVVVGYRNRKTGPCHPLVLLRCRRHSGPCFAVYPPGYSPYLRKRFAPVDSRGNLVRHAEISVAGDSGASWESTLMSAAIDAGRGERWSRDGVSDDLRRRRTQDRHLELSALLLGLSSALSTRTAQQIAGALGIAYLHLLESRRSYAAALTYVEKGAVVVDVVARLRADGTLWRRLLRAGELAAVWRTRRRWEPG